MTRPHHVLGLLLALVLSACAAPGPSRDPGYAYGTSSSLSALLSKPLSWDKLDGLETWLERYGPTASGRERNDARLALADGRESFIRQDQGKVSAAVLRMRRTAAQSDYQLVLQDGGASSSQRARAQHGLTRLSHSATALVQPASAPASASSGLAIITRATWGAAPENPRFMSRHKAPWSRITVHHTAMPLEADTSLAGRASELRQIQKSHLNKDEGWGDIGYEFVIDPEGRIYEGRRLIWRGAHVRGKNDHNLGICLMGNFDLQRPTQAALTSLERLLDDLRAKNGIPRSAVTWHRDWPSANTDCPGDNLVPYVRRYRDGGAIGSSLAHVSSTPAAPKRAPRWKPTSGAKVR